MGQSDYILGLLAVGDGARASKRDRQGSGGLGESLYPFAWVRGCILQGKRHNNGVSLASFVNCVILHNWRLVKGGAHSNE